MSLSNLKRHFIDRVKILRLEKTADNFGGYSTTESILASDVPARIYGASGLVIRQIAGSETRVTHKLMVAEEIDLQVLDIVEDQDGKRFTVIGLRDYRDSTSDHHKTADMATYPIK